MIQTQERYYALDALRVILIMGVIIGHSGLSFMVGYPDNDWYYSDASKHILMDGLIGFASTVLMPSFFLLSGFLSAKSIRNQTTASFLKRRLKRLLIPLVAIVLIFVPITNLYAFKLNGTIASSELIDYYPFVEGNIFNIELDYGWFLSYLFIFNLIHALLFKVFKKVKAPLSINIYWLLLLNIPLIFICLYSLNINILSGSYRLVPSFYSLLGYFGFYLIGLMAFKQNKLESFSTKYKNHFTILGLISLSLFYFLGYQKIGNQLHPQTFDIYQALSSCVSSTFLSLGLIGFSFIYLNKPIAIMRYLSNRTYFIYIIHMPFIVSLLWLLYGTEINVFIKFLIVLSGSILASLCINLIWVKTFKGNPPI